MSLSKLSPSPLYGCLGKIGLILALILGSGMVGWYAGKLWLHQSLNVAETSDILQAPDQRPTVEPSGRSPGETTISDEEIKRKTALRTRQKELGINRRFFRSFVNQIIALQTSAQTESSDFPNSTSPNSTAIAASQWDQSAAELLDQLAFLSPEALAKLGQYNRQGRDRQKQLVNRLNLSSRSLLDLAEANFYAHFPSLANQSFQDTPAEQVWDATIEETLKNLQAGNNYERLTKIEGSDRLQTQGNLQPGQGKAIVLRLQAQDNLTLILAANGNTQLSVYTPTGKTPILEDSPQKAWSGPLPETGFYEIVLVSKDASPIAYQLQLVTAN
jgi:serine/threonine-protein kinase